MLRNNEYVTPNRRVGNSNTNNGISLYQIINDVQTDHPRHNSKYYRQHHLYKLLGRLKDLSGIGNNDTCQKCTPQKQLDRSLAVNPTQLPIITCLDHIISFLFNSFLIIVLGLVISPITLRLLYYFVHRECPEDDYFNYFPTCFNLEELLLITLVVAPLDIFLNFPAYLINQLKTWCAI